MGANIPGKKREMLVYPGGLPLVLAEVQGIRRCRLRGFCPELRLKFPVGGYIRAPMAAERKSNARTRDLHDCSRWAVFVEHMDDDLSDTLKLYHATKLTSWTSF